VQELILFFLLGERRMWQWVERGVQPSGLLNGSITLRWTADRLRPPPLGCLPFMRSRGDHTTPIGLVCFTTQILKLVVPGS
jgi:hypothetical protein